MNRTHRAAGVFAGSYLLGGVAFGIVGHLRARQLCRIARTQDQMNSTLNAAPVAADVCISPLESFARVLTTSPTSLLLLGAAGTVAAAYWKFSG